MPIHQVTGTGQDHIAHQSGRLVRVSRGVTSADFDIMRLPANIKANRQQRLDLYHGTEIGFAHLQSEARRIPPMPANLARLNWVASCLRGDA